MSLRGDNDNLQQVLSAGIRVNEAGGDREELTDDMFGSYEAFETSLQQTFEVGDERRAAEHELRYLRQKTSASAYAAAFRQILTL